MTSTFRTILLVLAAVAAFEVAAAAEGQVEPPVEVVSERITAASRIDAGSPARHVERIYQNVSDRTIVAWEHRCIKATNDGRVGWSSVSEDAFRAAVLQRRSSSSQENKLIEPGDTIETSFGLLDDLEGPFAAVSCGLVLTVFDDGSYWGAPEIAEPYFARRRAMALDARRLVEEIERLEAGPRSGPVGEGGRLTGVRFERTGAYEESLRSILSRRQTGERLPVEELRDLKELAENELALMVRHLRPEDRRVVEEAESSGEQEDPSNEEVSSTADHLATEPLILSLEDGEYELSSADDPVVFDLDADGVAERISWTARGLDEAFLVLDRDRDGVVDDGMELFGDVSPQLPSAEPNGFRALAVYDDPINGGNGDGWIDRRDPIFEHLQLWVDSDHDAETDAGELRSLSEGGVEAFALDYRTTMRRDAHGNLYRYHADVIRSVGAGARIAWDVFFVLADDGE